jgi:hypothetical protein
MWGWLRQRIVHEQWTDVTTGGKNKDDEWCSSFVASPIAFYTLRGYLKYVDLFAQITDDRDYLEKSI